MQLRSTTWLLRHLADGLDANPEGFVLSLPECATALGLGQRGGRHSPFVRAIMRSCQFGMARADGPATLSVRRKLPPLTRRQAAALPEPRRTAHAAWLEAELAVPRALREQRRVRQLALSLLELGEDAEATERTLGRWNYHPALAREATAWALERHDRARAAGAHPAGPTGEADPERDQRARPPDPEGEVGGLGPGAGSQALREGSDPPAAPSASCQRASVQHRSDSLFR